MDTLVGITVLGFAVALAVRTLQSAASSARSRERWWVAERRPVRRVAKDGRRLV